MHAYSRYSFTPLLFRSSNLRINIFYKTSTIQHRKYHTDNSSRWCRNTKRAVYKSVVKIKIVMVYQCRNHRILTSLVPTCCWVCAVWRKFIRIYRSNAINQSNPFYFSLRWVYQENTVNIQITEPANGFN